MKLNKPVVCIILVVFGYELDNLPIIIQIECHLNEEGENMH